MRKILWVPVMILAVAASFYMRYSVFKLFHRRPRTADIPRIDRAYREAYKSGEGKADWEEILRTRKELEALVAAGDFARADAILASAQKDFETNPAREARLFWLFDAFSSANPDLEKPLTRWVETMPTSSMPLIARGEYREAMGWKGRGGKWIRETSEQQIKAMRGYFDLAEKDDTEALKINPRMITAYRTLIRIAMSESGALRVRQLAEEAFRINPASIQSMYVYMNALLPRWGGSYAAMDAFAEKAMSVAELQPEVRILAGMADWDRGRLLSDEDKDSAAADAFDRALEAGPGWDFYLDRGKALYTLDRNEEALADFDSALASRPLIVEPHAEKSLILFELGRYGDAEKSFRRAVGIDSFEKALKNFDRRAARGLTRFGYEEERKKNADKALEAYAMAIAKDSLNSDPYYYRAIIRYNRQDMEAALADALQANRADPHSLEACRLIDNILAHKGDWTGILTYWDAFLALEPRNAAAYFERSGTNYHAGRMDASQRDAKTACDLGLQEACRYAHTP